MNDFTRDELIILFLELNIAIRNWGEAKELKDYPRLKDKIMSMIHNYPEPCEHKDAEGFHLHFQGERITKINKCRKCGECYE